MAESIALQGFSFEEWNAHREEVVAKVMRLSIRRRRNSDGIIIVGIKKKRNR